MNEAADNQTNTVTAYVGLGSNLGDRAASLAAALRILGETPEIEVGQVSSLYASDPVGMTEQPEFLNAVAMLRTSLSAHRLLAALLDIENFLGRTRTIRWGPRVIDLDLLLYGDAQIESADLVVPHPRLAEREFVLTPLAEIAPNLVLPGGRRTVQALASELSAKNSAGMGTFGASEPSRIRLACGALLNHGDFVTGKTRHAVFVPSQRPSRADRDRGA